MYTLKQGKIAELRHYLDLMTILYQLGVAPKLGAIAENRPPAM